MSVLASAALLGFGPGLAAAFIAGLALDYFFIPPIYSFNIDDWRNGFSWFIFSLSSITMCVLADRLRKRAHAAQHEALLARRLLAMNQRLCAAKDVGAIARITVSAVGAALGARAILFIPHGETFEIVAHPEATKLSRA